MNRQPGSLSLLALIALGAVMGVSCAGVGPPVVAHPRSGGMTAVAPESEPLAGAVTLPPPAAERVRPSARAPSALALPAQLDLSATRARVVIRAGAWNLALGDAESMSEAPDVALSEAMTLSAGPAPQLGEPVAIIHVSEAAVEEGAWEASRR